LVPKERAEGWRSKRLATATPSVVAHLARPSEGFTSLLLASPALEPIDALRKLLPLCAPSAPFAVWCPFSQPLADALHALRRDRLAVNLALTEPWLRKHQVLPGRTHPTMTTGAGAGGFVLCGNWIPPEEEKAKAADGLGAAANAARDDAAGGGDEDTPETETGGGAKQKREDREGGSDGEVSGDDGVEPKKKAKK
jgi:tRNA (adenine-N(1)-)-methyltransferase non-catalytic subunit